MVGQRLKKICAFRRADILKIVAYRFYESRYQETYRIFEHSPVAVTVGVFLQYLVFEKSLEFSAEIGMEVVLQKIDIKIQVFLQKIEYVFEKRFGIGKYRREIELVQHAGYVRDNIVVYLLDDVGRVVVVQIKSAATYVCERTYFLYRQFVDRYRVQKLYGRRDYRSLRLSYPSVLGHKIGLLDNNLTKRAFMYGNVQYKLIYTRKKTSGQRSFVL